MAGSRMPSRLRFGPLTSRSLRGAVIIARYQRRWGADGRQGSGARHHDLGSDRPGQRLARRREAGSPVGALGPGGCRDGRRGAAGRARARPPTRRRRREARRPPRNRDCDGRTQTPTTNARRSSTILPRWSDCPVALTSTERLPTGSPSTSATNCATISLVAAVSVRSRQNSSLRAATSSWFSRNAIAASGSAVDSSRSDRTSSHSSGRMRRATAALMPRPPDTPRTAATRRAPAARWGGRCRRAR